MRLAIDKYHFTVIVLFGLNQLTFPVKKALGKVELNTSSGSFCGGTFLLLQYYIGIT